MDADSFSWAKHVISGGRIGYFHGRFQPFHFGHLAIIREAYAETGAVVVGISNPLCNSPVLAEPMDEDAIQALIEARTLSKNQIGRAHV